MISRWAQASELHELCSLWELCFGDGEEISGRFFDHFSPCRHTRVIREGEQLCAMASWLPMTVETEGASLPGAYVYAVATHPDYRGAGLCRRLMGELEQALRLDGIVFAALCPAEPSLYDYYASMGYETAFFCSLSAMQPTAASAAAVRVAPTEYLRIREATLTLPHCRWEEPALSYLQATGVSFYRLQNGCAAACTGGQDSIRVLELLSNETQSDIAALCHACGAAYAFVRAPGGKTRQGMGKYLGFKQNLPPLDLGFAFD